jgi:hypothetical protein
MLKQMVEGDPGMPCGVRASGETILSISIIAVFVACGDHQHTEADDLVELNMPNSIRPDGVEVSSACRVQVQFDVAGS